MNTTKKNRTSGSFLLNCREYNFKGERCQMKILRTFLIMTFFLQIFTACQANPKPNTTDSVITESILSIPTPTDTTSIIHGKLISKETNSPPEAIFYLAANSTANTKNAPAVLAFSNQNSPRAEVTATGEFVFRNVNPGQYAMMLWFPSKEPYFIPATDGQDYLWVNAKAGELLDLGKVVVP